MQNLLSARSAMRRALVPALMSLCMAHAAYAQTPPPEPRDALKHTIQGLQTGSLYTPAYNPQLLDVIRGQTGSRMAYPQLAALGPVVIVTIEAEIMIPNGTRYNMRAKHKRGVSNWILDIVRSPPFSPTDFRIETASFGIEEGSGDMPSLGNPGNEGDNCFKSPNMCPR